MAALLFRGLLYVRGRAQAQWFPPPARLRSLELVISLWAARSDTSIPSVDTARSCAMVSSSRAAHCFHTEDSVIAAHSETTVSLHQDGPRV